MQLAFELSCQPRHGLFPCGFKGPLQPLGPRGTPLLGPPPYLAPFPPGQASLYLGGSIRLCGAKGGGSLILQMARGAYDLSNAGARLLDLSANLFFQPLNAWNLNLCGLTLRSGTLRLDLRPQIGSLVLQAL